jgi:hypothetical protein
MSQNPRQRGIHKMRHLVIVGILISVAWRVPAIAENKVTISEQGKTIVEAKSKNLKIKASIAAIPVKSEPDAPYYYRRSCIQNVEIIVNGKQLIVPRSVYSDICHASEAEVVFKNNVGVFKIYGGDGAESFEVHVRFNSKMVTRRTVYAGELPDKPLEETRYWQREI